MEEFTKRRIRHMGEVDMLAGSGTVWQAREAINSIILHSRHACSWEGSSMLWNSGKGCCLQNDHVWEGGKNLRHTRGSWKVQVGGNGKAMAN